LALLTFAATVVGWIANASFRSGFLIVFPWAGVACFAAAVALSAYAGVTWFRLGKVMSEVGGFEWRGRPIRGGFKGLSYLFAAGIVWTKTGRIVTALGMAGIAGLLADLWAVKTDRELTSIVVASVGVSVAMLALAGGIQDEYEKIRASRKSCPDCGESVKQVARVCRYCGYRFSPPPAQSTGDDS
jgi:hypothetical protein